MNMDYCNSPWLSGRKRFWRVVNVVVPLAVILSSCGSAGSAKSTILAAQPLVIASGADAVTLDPGVSFDGQSPLLWRAVYESLLRFKGGTTEYEPELAESYTASDGGLTFTFKLRPNVKFTDGESFNSAAVKFNIERQMALGQGIAYALKPISNIELPDDLTVTLTLSAPSDGFLSAFASNYRVAMISPKAIKEHEVNGDWAQAWLRDHMVGTGAYMLESYSQGQQASFSRNLSYWRGWSGQHADRIIVKYVHDPSAERLMLEKGEVDIAIFMPDDVVEDLDGKPGVVVTDIPSYNLYYIGLPFTKGPTKDVRVRQAIAYGFDYETFIKYTLRGKAKQARGPIPSVFNGFNPDTPQYHYDLDKARQLLAEAGYPDGGFSLKYTYESGYFWKRPLGELFQANMKDLGITVEMQELSPSAWADLLSNPDTAEHAWSVVWWPSLATPFDYMWSLFHTDAQGTAGYNWSYYSSPKFDQLLYTAAADPDQAKRNVMYAQLQTLLVEDSPALFIYEKQYRLPMRDNVRGFVFNGMYIETFDLYSLYK